MPPERCPTFLSCSSSATAKPDLPLLLHPVVQHCSAAPVLLFSSRHPKSLPKLMDEKVCLYLYFSFLVLTNSYLQLLAILIRKKSKEELGFSPDIVSAVCFATPPCVSKALAENCASYVSTVVLQDDIIPRLSVASITRLRNEILATDWMSVLEKEDLKGVVDLVTNAKQFVSSVQDVARRLADYTKFRKLSDASDRSIKKDSASSQQNRVSDARTVVKLDGALQQETKMAGSDARTMVKLDGPKPEELFSPGMLYFLKRNFEEGSGSENSKESYTLWKREAGEHFQRILLSGNFITDHKCDSHYYALRDVLKSLPASDDRVYF